MTECTEKLKDDGRPSTAGGVMNFLSQTVATVNGAVESDTLCEIFGYLDKQCMHHIRCNSLELWTIGKRLLSMTLLLLYLALQHQHSNEYVCTPLGHLPLTLHMSVTTCDLKFLILTVNDVFCEMHVLWFTRSSSKNHRIAATTSTILFVFCNARLCRPWTSKFRWPRLYRWCLTRHRSILLDRRVTRLLLLLYLVLDYIMDRGVSILRSERSPVFILRLYIFISIFDTKANHC
jgi:hypothetical protein